MVAPAARILCVLLLVIAVAPVLGAQQGRRVNETEPNDVVTMANVIAFHDTILGTMSHPGNNSNDVDWFAFDLPAGTRLVIAGLDRNFCRDFHLYDAGVNHLAFMDCMEHSPNDTLLFPITVSGRYYMSVSQLDETPSDSPHPVVAYTIAVGAFVPPRGGVGDPTRLFASGLAYFSGLNSGGGITSSWSGDVYVHDVDGVPGGVPGERLMRVTPSGAVSTFADKVDSWGQIVIDGFGDLLVPGTTVSRYSLTSGARSEFTGAPDGDASAWTGIAIGPDGDVWVSAPGLVATGPYIAHFDPFGNREETIPITVGRVWTIAFSAAGVLHFITRDGNIYKLVDRAAILVVPTDGFQAYEHVAFDRDNWMYATKPGEGRVVLFDPQYRIVRNPLTQVLDSLGWADLRMGFASTFLRDQSGAMTARMVVTRNGWGFRSDRYEEHPGQPFRSEIRELNPAGMGAPGFDPTLHVDTRALRAGGRSVAYADTLRLVGTAGAATWAVVQGTLPPGINLASSTGVLSGTPADTGTFSFVVRARSDARAGFGRFTITVGDALPAQVSISDIANALLGGIPLSAEAIRYLDSHGNNNGQLDVGDLRAYLRAQGQLTGSPTP